MSKSFADLVIYIKHCIDLNKDSPTAQNELKDILYEVEELQGEEFLKFKRLPYILKENKNAQGC